QSSDQARTANAGYRPGASAGAQGVRCRSREHRLSTATKNPLAWRWEHHLREGRTQRKNNAREGYKGSPSPGVTHGQGEQIKNIVLPGLLPPLARRPRINPGRSCVPSRI
ncbi:MAG: hypothetical protein OXC07_03370, partial [Kistimonas sp.]|nr:hypothetical protein [Kistimonas sp.]